MSKETFFWDSMQKLSSPSKSRRPITKEELNIIYDVLEDIRGLWEAGNFVKLCAHLKKHTVQEIAKAVIDLKNNNFMYEETILNEKKKVAGSGPARRPTYFGHSFHDDFHRCARPAGYALRYPDNRISEGSRDMRDFLSQHFIHLTDRQKQSLSELRPWGKSRKAPQAP